MSHDDRFWLPVRLQNSSRKDSRSKKRHRRHRRHAHGPDVNGRVNAAYRAPADLLPLIEKFKGLLPGLCQKLESSTSNPSERGKPDKPTGKRKRSVDSKVKTNHNHVGKDCDEDDAEMDKDKSLQSDSEASTMDEKQHNDQESAAPLKRRRLKKIQVKDQMESTEILLSPASSASSSSSDVSADDDPRLRGSLQVDSKSCPAATPLNHDDSSGPEDEEDDLEAELVFAPAFSLLTHESIVTAIQSLQIIAQQDVERTYQSAQKRVLIQHRRQIRDRVAKEEKLAAAAARPHRQTRHPTKRVASLSSARPFPVPTTLSKKLRTVPKGNAAVRQPGQFRTKEVRPKKIQVTVEDADALLMLTRGPSPPATVLPVVFDDKDIPTSPRTVPTQPVPSCVEYISKMFPLPSALRHSDDRFQSLPSPLPVDLSLDDFARTSYKSVSNAPIPQVVETKMVHGDMTPSHKMLGVVASTNPSLVDVDTSLASGASPALLEHPRDISSSLMMPMSNATKGAVNVSRMSDRVMEACSLMPMDTVFCPFANGRAVSPLPCFAARNPSSLPPFPLIHLWQSLQNLSLSMEQLRSLSLPSPFSMEYGAVIGDLQLQAYCSALALERLACA